MERQEEVRANILNIIRDRSESGRLISAEEILTELKRRGLLTSEEIKPKTHLETALKQALQENRDVKEILAPNGVCYYYSVRRLSETYAGILVLKSENPLWLIAEVVRENSKRYPRPVPVAGFMESPFDLTLEAILECLRVMGEDKEYQDIAQTITSVGKTFLYSSRHLDPDYASMLAEWLDVGQADNP
ncbi:MAG: hypothetical protein FJ118_12175 [Deltaproteobacteria bacterium]|nr:hypothetical protein [Deltaproteobacteria bacterium]